jgi:hypothetical protein
VRIIAIVIALGCFLLGTMTASLPNARQPVWAAILFGYGAITAALVAFSFAYPVGKTILEWFLGLTILVTAIAYALPQSFWRLLGLRD